MRVVSTAVVVVLTCNLSGAIKRPRLKVGLGLNTHALSEKPERTTELISATTPAKTLHVQESPKTPNF